MDSSFHYFPTVLSISILLQFWHQLMLIKFSIHIQRSFKKCDNSSYIFLPHKIILSICSQYILKFTITNSQSNIRIFCDSQFSIRKIKNNGVLWVSELVWLVTNSVGTKLILVIFRDRLKIIENTINAEKRNMSVSF